VLRAKESIVHKGAIVEIFLAFLPLPLVERSSSALSPLEAELLDQVVAASSPVVAGLAGGLELGLLALLSWKIESIEESADPETLALA
jgi:hypothetical protein